LYVLASEEVALVSLLPFAKAGVESNAAVTKVNSKVLALFFIIFPLYDNKVTIMIY